MIIKPNSNPSSLRVRVSGHMTVDGREYVGKSAGSFRGLDLLEDMYMGGVPNYNAIARNAGFRQGFVGTLHASTRLTQNSQRFT